MSNSVVLKLFVSRAARGRARPSSGARPWPPGDGGLSARAGASGETPLRADTPRSERGQRRVMHHRMCERRARRRVAHRVRHLIAPQEQLPAAAALHAQAIGRVRAHARRAAQAVNDVRAAVGSGGAERPSANLRLSDPR